MSIIRWARVSTRIEGWHRWPDAPEKQHYLSHRHRHMFHVTLSVEQQHNDRDVEYHAVLVDLRQTLEALDFTWSGESTLSCEAIAEAVITTFANHILPGRNLKCEVSEDGENGAMLEYTAPSFES